MHRSSGWEWAQPMFEPRVDISQGDGGNPRKDWASSSQKKPMYMLLPGRHASPCAKPCLHIVLGWVDRVELVKIFDMLLSAD